MRLFCINNYMYCEEIYHEPIVEKMVWARSGKRAVRKYRCTSGTKRGRIVSKASSCYSAPSLKKRTALKKTRARIGKRMARKAQRTKRISPLSKRIARLNKPSKRKR